jgi:crotonobetainyl-CoA:carnitine CoA-transferase CaiB-like acyl-CoA transferase
VSDALVGRLWQRLGGDPKLLDAVRLTGPRRVLPAVFNVTGMATAAVAVAALAAAAVQSARTQTAVRSVTVDRRRACATFFSEGLFQPVGWKLPPVWDPIAGDYTAADGWIRLHTNYKHHRAAVERVLGSVADRDATAERVGGWAAQDLERAVVEAGGCAAAMQDRPAWLASPAGTATVGEPVAHITIRPSDAGAHRLTPTAVPYAGVRVLDLTRVIAGPVATRFLAMYGADVLRIDPPGFDEVPAVVPDVTVGKHCTALDLTERADRAIFEHLLADADVLVHGLRPGALAGLGYDAAELAAINPRLITASHNAYGWSGPWQGRRGFDSLVQMSCGIAAAGASRAGTDRPVPLPVQALDHATGYLLAASVGLALHRAMTDGVASHIRCSLIGTANLLWELPDPAAFAMPKPIWSERDTVPVATSWGPARRVPSPVEIDGVSPGSRVDAGPLGRHQPQWQEHRPAL